MNNKNLTNVVKIQKRTFSDMISYIIANDAITMVFDNNEDNIITCISLYYFDNYKTNMNYTWMKIFKRKHKSKPFEAILKTSDEIFIDISSKEFVDKLREYDEKILYSILECAPIIY